MIGRKRLSGFCLFCSMLVLALFHAAHVASGQVDRYEGATITGTAAAFSGRLAGRTAPFRLIINRYTGPEELQRLNEALQSGGQDRLLSVLSRMDAGQIEVGGGVGNPANVIIATPQPNGEVKITVIYQRNVRFSELRYGTRSADYRFGYAELYLRPNGAGQGMLIPAAKIRLRDGNTWEVEDFGSFPARLMGLQVRGGRRPR